MTFIVVGSDSVYHTKCELPPIGLISSPVRQIFCTYEMKVPLLCHGGYLVGPITVATDLSGNISNIIQTFLQRFTIALNKKCALTYLAKLQSVMARIFSL